MPTSGGFIPSSTAEGGQFNNNRETGGPLSSAVKLPLKIVDGALGVTGTVATGGIGAVQSVTNTVLTPVSGALSFLGPFNAAAIVQGASNTALGATSGIIGGTINTIREPLKK